VFIEFLKRLIHGAKEMIFLIVDRHPVHRAKSVEAYLKTVSNRLRLYILAPYAPELNPDEYVWNDLKNNAVGRMAIKTSADLKKTAISRLRFLQKIARTSPVLFLCSVVPTCLIQSIPLWAY
jgi:transposase